MREGLNTLHFQVILEEGKWPETEVVEGVMAALSVVVVLVVEVVNFFGVRCY